MVVVVVVGTDVFVVAVLIVPFELVEVVVPSIVAFGVPSWR